MQDMNKVINWNSREFVKDLKRCRAIVVQPKYSLGFFKVTKSEVLREAQECKIEYFLSELIYKNGRLTMVIK